jgi:esterase/lipase
MNKKQLMKPFQDLKQEIEKLRKKHLVQGLVDKFHSEKKSLEKRIEKAKKFMTEQKKELNKIQKKVEVVLKKKKTTTKKKVAKKVAPKATKKIAAKTTKKKASSK